MDSNEALVQAASAAIGGVVSTVVLFPLDVIKTKMQAQRTSEEGSSPNSMDTFWSLWRSGGVPALFSGVVPGAVQSGIEKSIYFFAYSLLKESYFRFCGVFGTGGNLLVGYVSDWIHLPVSLPIDRVVKRIQTQHDQKKSAMAIINDIHAEQGWTGFYKGVWAYVVLCGRPAIQFTVYEQLRALLLAAKSAANISRIGTPQGARVVHALSSWEAFFLGALSRAIATLVVYPFIRAKVMAQAALKASAVGINTESRGSGHGQLSTELPVKPLSVFASVQALHSTEGVAGLYRGVKPELLRGVLSAAVMLMIKEKTYMFNKRLLSSSSSRPIPTSA